MWFVEGGGKGSRQPAKDGSLVFLGKKSPGIFKVIWAHSSIQVSCERLGSSWFIGKHEDLTRRIGEILYEKSQPHLRFFSKNSFVFFLAWLASRALSLLANLVIPQALPLKGPRFFGRGVCRKNRFLFRQNQLGQATEPRTTSSNPG